MWPEASTMFVSRAPCKRTTPFQSNEHTEKGQTHRKIGKRSMRAVWTAYAAKLLATTGTLTHQMNFTEAARPWGSRREISRTSGWLVWSIVSGWSRRSIIPRGTSGSAFPTVPYGFFRWGTLPAALPVERSRQIATAARQTPRIHSAKVCGFGWKEEEIQEKNMVKMFAVQVLTWIVGEERKWAQTLNTQWRELPKISSRNF